MFPSGEGVKEWAAIGISTSFCGEVEGIGGTVEVHVYPEEIETSK